MGVILDSSVLIAGERRGQSVRQILKAVQSLHGESDFVLSVVTVVELTHGIYRAKTDLSRERRQSFCDELRRDVVVHPITLEIAELAGRIEASKHLRVSVLPSRIC